MVKHVHPIRNPPKALLPDMAVSPNQSFLVRTPAMPVAIGITALPPLDALTHFELFFLLFPNFGISLPICARNTQITVHAKTRSKTRVSQLSVSKNDKDSST